MTRRTLNCSRSRRASTWTWTLSKARTIESLQRRLHPDKFTLAGEEDQQLATECSSRVNEAYMTLKIPFHRASYLLQLHSGIDINEEATMSGNQELLLEVMEAREAIEDAETLDDVEGVRQVTASNIAACQGATCTFGT